MSDFRVSVILHQTGSEDNPVKNTLKSIYNQTCRQTEIIIIDHSDKNKNPGFYNSPIPLTILNADNESLGSQLKRAITKISAPYILYIDNRNHQVELKSAALDLLLQHMNTHSQTGMLYSDYEIYDGQSVSSKKLLKHHPGRLRDNQDYGKVFMFRASALAESGGFDDTLKFNTLYDIRLKISEKYKLSHIADKYNGALYKVWAKAKGQNVFDYLMAGKESQLEAEAVLKRHLEKSGTFLAAGQHYMSRPPYPNDLVLDATVIIPVNNRPEFIGTAIESVLIQTINTIEVIVVVNGGENDPTVAEVKRYMKDGDLYRESKPQVRLLVYDINNIGFCLNMGAKFAKGKYYIQLDSDDRLKPDAVEKILQVFHSDPKIGMVIGSYEVWEKKPDGSLVRDETIPVVTHDEWTDENGRNNLLRINGAGAPRSIPINLIRQFGFGMNEEPYSRNYGEDYDMVLRLSEKYKMGRIWEPIYEVVRHSGGTDHSIDQFTVDQNDEAKDWMRLQAINRRRNMNLTMEPKADGK
ncbi:MAG: glycosyltransferase family 2 protein [Calditrichaceae bacterium]|nr:glycosyltransferase family 2 protein [Calditrichaceae bacterium]MBN2709949.1 glycosyltransferase family 2 protein [Calditrichaceae bacterium]RQV92699.1 MAG: glycosyltransferase family 2 protein [Calditrichota bacterium]